jgi:AcrR family transcriptional regulator
MRAYRPIADRRRQLVDASLAIAERDGVGAVTVRRVAAEAGVSLGLVSYCFASKEELTIAMAARIVQELADAGELASEQSGLAAATGSAGAGAAVPTVPAVQSIDVVLRAALSGLWSEVERTPARQLLTYEITTRALREPGLIGVAQEQYATTAALTAGVLASAAETAGVRWTRDLDHLAGLVVMAIDGATLRWLVDQDSEAALARLGDIADLLATMAV